MTSLPTFIPLLDRVLPGGEGAASAATGGGGETSLFNILFIVGFAVIISVLARWLAARGRRK